MTSLRLLSTKLLLASMSSVSFSSTTNDIKNGLTPTKPLILLTLRDDDLGDLAFAHIHIHDALEDVDFDDFAFAFFGGKFVADIRKVAGKFFIHGKFIGHATFDASTDARNPRRI